MSFPCRSLTELSIGRTAGCWWPFWGRGVLVGGLSTSSGDVGGVLALLGVSGLWSIRSGLLVENAGLSARRSVCFGPLLGMVFSVLAFLGVLNLWTPFLCCSGKSPAASSALCMASTGLVLADFTLLDPSRARPAGKRKKINM